MVIETLERLAAGSTTTTTRSSSSTTTPTDPALWQPGRGVLRAARTHQVPPPRGLARVQVRRAQPRADAVTDPRAERDRRRRRGLPGASPTSSPSARRSSAIPRSSFVQTPQDYRDWRAAPYFRRLYYSYGYFFDVSQRSRNERNGAIFGGTMGLIRRSRARGRGRLGRVVHHRGRRAVAAAAQGGRPRDPRRPLLRLRRHAADVRGPQAAALPLVLRRESRSCACTGARCCRVAAPMRTGSDPAQRWAYLVGGTPVVRRPGRPCCSRSSSSRAPSTLRWGRAWWSGGSRA